MLCLHAQLASSGHNVRAWLASELKARWEVTNLCIRREDGGAHAGLGSDNLGPALIRLQRSFTSVVGGVILRHVGEEIFQGVFVARLLGGEDSVPGHVRIHAGIEHHLVRVLREQGGVGRAQEGAVRQASDVDALLAECLAHDLPVTGSVFCGDGVGVTRGVLLTILAGDGANLRQRNDWVITRVACRAVDGRGLAQATRLHTNDIELLLNLFRPCGVVDPAISVTVRTTRVGEQAALARTRCLQADKTNLNGALVRGIVVGRYGHMTAFSTLMVNPLWTLSPRDGGLVSVGNGGNGY